MPLAAHPAKPIAVTRIIQVLLIVLPRAAMQLVMTMSLHTSKQMRLKVRRPKVAKLAPFGHGAEVRDRGGFGGKRATASQSRRAFPRGLGPRGGSGSDLYFPS